jgi:hypothetical protein
MCNMYYWNYMKILNIFKGIFKTVCSPNHYFSVFRGISTSLVQDRKSTAGRLGKTMSCRKENLQGGTFDVCFSTRHLIRFPLTHWNKLHHSSCFMVIKGDSEAKWLAEPRLRSYRYLNKETSQVSEHKFNFFCTSTTSHIAFSFLFQKSQAHR